MIDKEKARALVNDLINRGIMKNDEATISAQIDEITQWNDEAFDSMGRVVNQYASTRGNTFDYIEKKQSQAPKEKQKTDRVATFYVRCWLFVMKGVAVVIRNIMLHCLSILHIDPQSVPRNIDLEELIRDLNANFNQSGGERNLTEAKVDGTNNIDDPLNLPVVKKTLSFIGRKTPQEIKRSAGNLTKGTSNRRTTISKHKVKGNITKKVAKTTRKKK